MYIIYLHKLIAVVSFALTTNFLVHGYASFKISPESLVCSLYCRCKHYNFQQRNFAVVLYGCVTWPLTSKGELNAEGV